MRIFTARSFFVVVAFLGMHALTFSQEKAWAPLAREELEMKTPVVDPDAEAEVLFWQVRILDDFVPRAGFKTVLNHHIRIKIFTERGRENNSKVDIPFGRIADLGFDVDVMDIAARTIKPDGTIIEVKPSDIFQRELVRGNGVKVKARSFPMPGIEVGSIVEYRWKEVRSDSLSYYLRLDFSRDIPVHKVTYLIKPVSAPRFGLGMRIHAINVRNAFAKDSDDFYRMTMTNVPAFRVEPRMPSEYIVKPWMLVYYADPRDDTETPEKYWDLMAKRSFEGHKSWLKPSSDIRRAASQSAGDAVDPEEKIKRILDFCRKNIKNIDDDASGLSLEQRRSFKPNADSAETLKKQAGTWHDLNMLFGAMLAGLDFEVRVANVASRTEPPLDKSLTNDFFVRSEVIAVKLGADWKYFDASDTYLPYGMLSWNSEGEAILVSDDRSALWRTAPVSSAERSVKKRSAKLTLASDGSLEGDVRIEYTGHAAAAEREKNDDDSPAERENNLIKMVRRDVHSAAEITAISIENLSDAERPFAYSFRLRIPGYLESVGKRSFLRPNIFERRTNSLFSAGRREYDVSFQYRWMEEDDIAILMPSDLSPESLEPPRPIDDKRFGGSQQSKLSLSDDKRTLNYSRRFKFGGDSKIEFAVGNYAEIRQLFDAFHQADSFAVSLKRS